jgi:integrase
MASLYQRENGTYYASFYSNNQSPKQKRFSLKTTRKKIARRLLTDLERAYEAGEFSPWTDGKKGDPFRYDEPDVTPVPLDELIERFCERKESQGRSERTVESYRGVWRRFMKRAGEDTLTKELRPSKIAAFCYEADVSQSTRHKRFRHVRAVVNWGEENGYFEGNPVEDVDPPKEAKKVPTPVRPDELRQICEAIRRIYREKRQDGHCRPREIIWTIPLYRFAYFSGLRSSELARLRWKDIDEEEGQIFIGEEQKGKRETYVPLIREARKVLRYVGTERTPNNYVFKTPNGDPAERSERCFADTASRWFCAARKKAGIERRITLHSLRAGFATRLAENGASAHVIRKAMRHATIQTAMKYIDVAGRTVKDEVEAAFN